MSPRRTADPPLSSLSLKSHRRAPIALARIERSRSACDRSRNEWIVRILLVDDDNPVRCALGAMLREAGMDVVECASGDTARLLARRIRVDAVICDLYMRDGDGIDLLRDMRAQSRATPVIAISGGGTHDIDLLPIARVLGACQALYKPVSPSDLLRSVAEATSRG